MKLIKIIAFVLVMQGIASLSFAVGTTSPTAQDQLANEAYCRTHGCNSAMIATGDGGSSFWYYPPGSSNNGSGLYCDPGYVWSASLGGCVLNNTQQNAACVYPNGTATVTQPSGTTWDCLCSGTTVNLATCTCNNGTITRNTTGCEKFTKYKVCDSNPCKTQTGSCYKGDPNNCVWNSCASGTANSSLVNDSANSATSTLTQLTQP